MHVLKSSTAVVPAIIGAVAAVLAALLSFIAAIRAQSRRQLLEDIDALLRKYADDELDDFKDELRQILDARTRGLYINEIVKRGLREVLREHSADDRRHRRHWWQRGR